MTATDIARSIRTTSRVTSALSFGAAATVVVGLATMPIGYYSLERWAVTALSVVLIVLTTRVGAALWAIALLPVIVLWNPLVPIVLTRSAWQPIDLAAALTLLVLGVWSLRRADV